MSDYNFGQVILTYYGYFLKKRMSQVKILKMDTTCLDFSYKNLDSKGS